jgi:hypothetical protein
MSFMYITNSMGPSTLPCGMPLVTGRTVSNKTKLENKSSYHLYNNEGEEVELEMSEGKKDIGVLVDRNLSFSKHIAQKVNKANSIC